MSGRSWKIQLRPYKAYIQALYPDARNPTARVKKSDFSWVNGKPFPKIRADIRQGIERALTPMPITEALAKYQPRDVVQVELIYSDMGFEIIDGIPELEIIEQPDSGAFEATTIGSLNSTDDVEKMKMVPTINRDYLQRAANAFVDYRVKINRAHTAREVQAIEMGKSFTDAQFYEMAVKDVGDHPFLPFNAFFRRLGGWMIDKRLFKKSSFYFNDELKNYEPDKFFPLIYTKRSIGIIRPPNTPLAGPAFDAPIGNCAINTIRQMMEPITPQESDIFDKLQAKYAQGVWPTDYEKIARKLKIGLKITYAPNTKAVEVWTETGKAKEDLEQIVGYKNKRMFHLHHWSNHTSALAQKADKEYHYATVDEMKELMIKRSHQLYQSNQHSLTFRAEDGKLQTYQLSEVDGVQLPLGKLSPQSAMFDEFAKEIVSYNYNDPNRPAYDCFPHHGIHYSTGAESMNDIDLDLNSAYSNFFKLRQYRGLPRDITYWIDNPTIEQVRANIGFVLCTFINPFASDATVDRLYMWLSCYEVKILYANDCIIAMHQAAFAHATFDLQMDKFVDLDPEVEYVEDADGNEVELKHYKIGKRVFHMVLGLSTATESRKSFYTQDILTLTDIAHATTDIKLPCDVVVADEDDSYHNFTGIRAVKVKYEIKNSRVSHVAATIQGLIASELFRKFFELKRSNPNVRVKTALVDGLRLDSKTVDRSTIKLDNGMWKIKPVQKVSLNKYFDWPQRSLLTKKAEISSPELTRMNWPIKINPTFHDMMNVAKPDGISFLQLCNEGFVSSLQGFAGTGKSYTVRKLLEQFNGIILTPTHSTREDMESHTIRDSSLGGVAHLFGEEIDDALSQIPVMTYQAAIQRPETVRAYQVVIIDEVGMVRAEELNRIAEIVGRKPILLVGDPAQHTAITCDSKILQAKYVVFKEHIMADEKLSQIYENGSQWEINNMLTHLHYDCMFDPPEDLDLSIEADYDEAERLREAHVNEKKDLVSHLAKVMSKACQFITARDVPAFDLFSGGKMLTKIMRAENTADGQALVEFCAKVRKDGISAIQDFVKKNPSRRITKITDYDKQTIISVRNQEINSHNMTALRSFNNAESESMRKRLEAELDSTECKATRKCIAQRLKYIAPNVELAIIARETFSYNGVKVFNGTRGTLKDFEMTFNGHQIPLCEVRTPKHKTANNPFMRPIEWIPSIQLMYAITSYRAQGRTMAEKDIVIDCSVISPEMLYVACTRATRLSQLKFILPEEIGKAKRSNMSTRLKKVSPIPYTDELQTRFGFGRITRSETILVSKRTIDLAAHLNGFDWMEYADIDLKLILDNNFDLAAMGEHLASISIDEDDFHEFADEMIDPETMTEIIADNRLNCIFASNYVYDSDSDDDDSFTAEYYSARMMITRNHLSYPLAHRNRQDATTAFHSMNITDDDDDTEDDSFTNDYYSQMAKLREQQYAQPPLIALRTDEVFEYDSDASGYDTD